MDRWNAIAERRARLFDELRRNVAKCIKSREDVRKTLAELNDATDVITKGSRSQLNRSKY